MLALSVSTTEGEQVMEFEPIKCTTFVFDQSLMSQSRDNHHDIAHNFNNL